MWRCVGLVKTDISEERVASIFKVEETLFLLYVNSSLKMETTPSFETSILYKTHLAPLPEDGILHSPRRENLKSYNKPLSQVCMPKKL
jgi:hypothetical protein